MLLDGIPTGMPRDGFDMTNFARSVVLRGIEAAVDDPSEQKFRIMLARQCGFLSDAETTRMIAEKGLAAA